MKSHSSASELERLERLQMIETDLRGAMEVTRPMLFQSSPGFDRYELACV